MHGRRRTGRPRSYRTHPSLYRQRRVAPVRETKQAKPNTNAIKLSDRVEEVRILCREISSAMSKVEKWMNAAYNISRAVRDKNTLGELISAISAIETQDIREELKEVPTINPDEVKASDYDNVKQVLSELLQKLNANK